MSRSRPSRAGPWGPTERLRVGIGLGSGILLWLGASIAANASSETGGQLAPGVVGVAAVGVVCVSALGWLTYGRRAVGLRMELLLGQAATDAPATRGIESTLVAVVGLSLYHRSDCVMVRGKPTEVRQRAEHDALGLRGCGMCGTDDA